MTSIYDNAITSAAKLLGNLQVLEDEKNITSDSHKSLLASTGICCFKCFECVDEIINAEEKREEEESSRQLTGLVPRNTLNADFYIDELTMTVHMEFDGRLPSRKELTGGHESYKRTVFKKMLLETVLFIFQDYPGFFYRQKADLLIYQEYASSTVARDHDNTDIKAVIDCLCLGHMVDDSPDYLRLRLDGGVTGRNRVSIHLTQIS